MIIEMRTYNIRVGRLNDFINIYDDPFVLRGLASSPYDAEGAEVCASYLIQEGVLNQFLLGSYSARKLNMEPNGHSGGAHNIIVSDIKEQLGFDNLLKKMDYLSKKESHQ